MAESQRLFSFINIFIMYFHILWVLYCLIERERGKLSLLSNYRFELCTKRNKLVSYIVWRLRVISGLALFGALEFSRSNFTLFLHANYLLYSGLIHIRNHSSELLILSQVLYTLLGTFNFERCLKELRFSLHYESLVLLIRLSLLIHFFLESHVKTCRARIIRYYIVKIDFVEATQFWPFCYPRLIHTHYLFL